MTNFWTGFLGALTGAWLAIVLSFFTFLIFIAVIVASGSSDSPSKKIKKDTFLHLDMSGAVVDRDQPASLLEGLYGQAENTIALEDLRLAIETAKSDDKIRGIFLECNGISAGLAQTQAILDALASFRESGKPVYAYSDNYSQGDYLLACGADSIFLNPIGMVDIHGLSSTILYFKDLLDKLGVEVQVVKVGTYKSAVEPFILNDISDANREQTLHFLSRIWGTLKSRIADSRGVPADSVNVWADSFTFAKAADTYVNSKIVDRLVYRHEMDSVLLEGTDMEKPRLISLDEYCATSAVKNAMSPKGSKKIAVLYALGDITEDGEDGIASSRLVPQILDLAKDDDVDGLILRVNSGGGSAFASEQIWEALQQFKKLTGKPFYVSMGDVAASGGYYISCGADRIYAEPLTLTGSIGIFGLIPNAQKLLNDKLGVHTATVATNTGSFPELFKPMPAPQREAMQGYVNRGYKLFAERCAAGRHLPVDSIYAIAQGRVWDGASAHEIGLVDKMGGLQLAISDMAAELDAADDYRVVSYPDNSDNIWAQVRTLRKNIETRIVGNQLGAAADYYFKLRAVAEMSPLQCRMEIMMME